MTRERFISRASEKHDNRYDYSQTDYSGVDNRLTIVCPIHGAFEQTGTNHLYGGHGCIKCRNDKQRKSSANFISEAVKLHGNLYDYSDVNYQTAHTKVVIKCAKHGEFDQTPHSHLHGDGCPSCHHKNEHEVGELLRNILPDWKITRRKLLWKSYQDYHKSRFCDFFLERGEFRIVVEYDGEQHFRPVRFAGMSRLRAEQRFQQQLLIDRLDAEFCKERDFRLWRIPFDADKRQKINELACLIQRDQIICDDR